MQCASWAHTARLRARAGYSLLQNCMAFSYSASAASLAYLRRRAARVKNALGSNPESGAVSAVSGTRRSSISAATSSATNASLSRLFVINRPMSSPTFSTPRALSFSLSASPMPGTVVTGSSTLSLLSAPTAMNALNLAVAIALGEGLAKVAKGAFGVSLFCPRWLLLTRQALARPPSERVAGRCRLLRRCSSKGRRRAVPRRAVPPPRRAAARVLFAMSNTVLRREGDTVHLEHKYYGKFKFREAAPLADAAAASAMVFAGERTDGCAPPAARRAARRSPFAAADATPRAAARRRAWPSSSTTATRRVRKACPAFALRPDAGGRRTQVYSDHMHWSQLYYNPATRFAGLPWILSQTIPEAPWGDKKVDVMVSELLGDSLEAVRLRNPEVRCVSRGRCYARVSDGRSLPSARCRPVRCAASPCRRWTCSLPCTPPASCTATSSPPTCWRVACLARVANVP